MEIIEQILEQIKSVRKARKIKLNQMAEKLNITPSSYRKIEEGMIELKVKTMFDIFNILEIKLDSKQIDEKELLVYERFDVDNFAKKDDIKKIEAKLEETQKILLEVLKKLESK